MSDSERTPMGHTTAILKAVFISLSGAVAIWLVVYGAIEYPEPDGILAGGTGLIVILMLGTAWATDPHGSMPK